MQLGETAGPLPLPVAKNTSHGDLGVVIKDGLRNAAKEAERPNMAVAEGFRRLGGVADHEAGVRVRQVKSEEVDLALHAADDADSFAKVDLGMSRRMLQRHKHLLSPLTPAGDVILHNREAAREAVLVPETLKDPLRRMLLFPRARLVVEENPVDHRDERIKLRLGRRLCAHVTRRRRELHHLGDRARVNSKPSRRRAMAQSLDLNRVANAPIKLHALHPPPSADPTQRDICCRTFAPALPENPAASVRDYCSAAYTNYWRKDPADSRWANAPDYKEWAAFVDMNPADRTDGFAVLGFASAALMTYVLKQCGDDLSRDGIMRQATNLKDYGGPMGLPGAKANTSPTDYRVTKQLQLARFNGVSWEWFGDVLTDE